MAGSTYSGTFENSVEINNGQGWMEEKHRKLLGAQPKKFGTKWREVVYQRQAPNSFYQTDFGIYGDGMAAQLPKDPLGFSKAASTADLFHGSNKVFQFSPVFQNTNACVDDASARLTFASELTKTMRAGVWAFARLHRFLAGDVRKCACCLPSKGPHKQGNKMLEQQGDACSLRG